MRIKSKLLFLLNAVFVVGGLIGYEVDELRHSSSHQQLSVTHGVGHMQISPGRHAFRHLIFSCMDGRVWPTVADWIRAKWHDDADLITWPGVSAVINDLDSQALFMRALSTAQRLHDTTVLHLVHHRDCGGYGGSKRFHGDAAAERAYHVQELVKAAEIVRKFFPGMTIHLYFLELDGTITEVTPAEIASLNRFRDSALSVGEPSL